MRRISTLTLIAAVVAAGCGASTATASITASPHASSPAAPTATPVASVGPTATPAPPTATPVPSPTMDPAAQHFIDAAKAYAAKAGITVDSSRNSEFAIDNAGYSGDVLPRVNLALAGSTDGSGTLQVIFGKDGAIVAVENHGPNQPLGKAITVDEAVATAHRELELAGAPLQVTPKLIFTRKIGSGSTAEWEVLYPRSVKGYRVADWPEAWGVDGDKAYVLLRADGSLIEFYAIQPPVGEVPVLLPVATLKTKLAAAVKSTTAGAAAEAASFEWVRGSHDGVPDPTLSLGYCQRHAWGTGWWETCVDAGSGDALVQQGAAD